MNSTEVRTRLLERLTKDLLGPKQADEELPSDRLPRDAYLTGILYPQQSQIDSDHKAEPNAEEGAGSDLGESTFLMR